MPQVDIKYSDDLNIDIQKLFHETESTINELDASAGVCKSRAYPSKNYLHRHFYMRVALLKKPHRDDAFMKNCLERLETIAKAKLPSGAYCSVELVFSNDYYLTSKV